MERSIQMRSALGSGTILHEASFKLATVQSLNKSTCIMDYEYILCHRKFKISSLSKAGVALIAQRNFIRKFIEFSHRQKKIVERCFDQPVCTLRKSLDILKEIKLDIGSNEA